MRTRPVSLKPPQAPRASAAGRGMGRLDTQEITAGGVEGLEMDAAQYRRGHIETTFMNAWNGIGATMTPVGKRGQGRRAFVAWPIGAPSSGT